MVVDNDGSQALVLDVAEARAMCDALEAAESERDAWQERAQIVTAKRQAVVRVTRDLRKQRNDAETRTRDVGAVLDQHHPDHARDLWIDIHDDLSESTG